MSDLDSDFYYSDSEESLPEESKKTTHDDDFEREYYKTKEYVNTHTFRDKMYKQMKDAANNSKRYKHGLTTTYPNEGRATGLQSKWIPKSEKLHEKPKWESDITKSLVGILKKPSIKNLSKNTDENINNSVSFRMDSRYGGKESLDDESNFNESDFDLEDLDDAEEYQQTPEEITDSDDTELLDEAEEAPDESEITEVKQDLSVILSAAGDNKSQVKELADSVGLGKDINGEKISELMTRMEKLEISQDDKVQKLTQKFMDQSDENAENMKRFMDKTQITEMMEKLSSENKKEMDALRSDIAGMGKDITKLKSIAIKHEKTLNKINEEMPPSAKSLIGTISKLTGMPVSIIVLVVASSAILILAGDLVAFNLFWAGMLMFPGGLIIIPPILIIGNLIKFGIFTPRLLAASTGLIASATRLADLVKLKKSKPKTAEKSRFQTLQIFGGFDQQFERFLVNFAQTTGAGKNNFSSKELLKQIAEIARNSQNNNLSQTSINQMRANIEKLQDNFGVFGGEEKVPEENSSDERWPVGDVKPVDSSLNELMDYAYEIYGGEETEEKKFSGEGYLNGLVKMTFYAKPSSDEPMDEYEFESEVKWQSDNNNNKFKTVEINNPELTGEKSDRQLFDYIYLLELKIGDKKYNINVVEDIDTESSDNKVHTIKVKSADYFTVITLSDFKLISVEFQFNVFLDDSDLDELEGIEDPNEDIKAALDDKKVKVSANEMIKILKSNKDKVKKISKMSEKELNKNLGEKLKSKGKLSELFNKLKKTKEYPKIEFRNETIIMNFIKFLFPKSVRETIHSNIEKYGTEDERENYKNYVNRLQASENPVHIARVLANTDPSINILFFKSLPLKLKKTLAVLDIVFGGGLLSVLVPLFILSMLGASGMFTYISVYLPIFHIFLGPLAPPFLIGATAMFFPFVLILLILIAHIVVGFPLILGVLSAGALWHIIRSGKYGFSKLSGESSSESSDKLSAGIYGGSDTDIPKELINQVNETLDLIRGGGPDAKLIQQFNENFPSSGAKIMQEVRQDSTRHAEKMCETLAPIFGELANMMSDDGTFGGDEESEESPDDFNVDVEGGYDLSDGELDILSEYDGGNMPFMGQQFSPNIGNMPSFSDLQQGQMPYPQTAGSSWGELEPLFADFSSAGSIMSTMDAITPAMLSNTTSNFMSPELFSNPTPDNISQNFDSFNDVFKGSGLERNIHENDAMDKLLKKDKEGLTSLIQDLKELESTGIKRFERVRIYYQMVKDYDPDLMNYFKDLDQSEKKEIHQLFTERLLESDQETVEELKAFSRRRLDETFQLPTKSEAKKIVKKMKNLVLKAQKDEKVMKLLKKKLGDPDERAKFTDALEKLKSNLDIEDHPEIDKSIREIRKGTPKDVLNFVANPSTLKLFTKSSMNMSSSIAFLSLMIASVGLRAGSAVGIGLLPISLLFIVLTVVGIVFSLIVTICLMILGYAFIAVGIPTTEIGIGILLIIGGFICLILAMGHLLLFYSLIISLSVKLLITAFTFMPFIISLFLLIMSDAAGLGAIISGIVYTTQKGGW